MNRRTLVFVLVVGVLCVSAGARKTSYGRSRSSGRSSSSSRRTSYTQAPSHSYPARTAAGGAAGTSLFGWQTKKHDTPSHSSQSANTFGSRQTQWQQNTHHSYPNSATGLSGNRPPSYEQSKQTHQTHSYPSQNNQHTQQQSAPKHSYPASNTGLSGSGAAGNAHSPYSGASAPAYTGAGQQARPGGAPPPYSAAGAAPAYGNNHYQGAPPPYSAPGYSHSNPGYGHSNPGYGHSNPGYNAPGYGGVAPGYGHAPGYHAPGYHPPSYGAPGYGNYGSHGGFGGGGYSGAGNFGGYNYGGVRKGTSTLAKVGIAGAGVGTLLTGLALWNLARSGSGHSHKTVIYQDRYGNPVPYSAHAPASGDAGRDPEPVNDPILGELVNCTLTISGAEATEVIGIPCAIATSFSPNSDLTSGVDHGGNTKEARCTITVVTKNNTEFSTTVPCSIFLNTAKAANVTEPPPTVDNFNNTQLDAQGQPQPAPAAGQPITGQPIPGPGQPIAGQPIEPVPGQSQPIQPVPGQGLPQQVDGQNQSPSLGPPLDVPLAPFPDGTNQGGYGPNANPPPPGYPVGVPLALPTCKPGATPDPLAPCIPESQALNAPASTPGNAAAPAA